MMDGVKQRYTMMAGAFFMKKIFTGGANSQNEIKV
jgi:hypothetical protein